MPPHQSAPSSANQYATLQEFQSFAKFVRTQFEEVAEELALAKTETVQALNREKSLRKELQSLKTDLQGQSNGFGPGRGEVPSAASRETVAELQSEVESLRSLVSRTLAQKIERCRDEVSKLSSDTTRRFQTLQKEAKSLQTKADEEKDRAGAEGERMTAAMRRSEQKTEGRLQQVQRTVKDLQEDVKTLKLQRYEERRTADDSLERFEKELSELNEWREQMSCCFDSRLASVEDLISSLKSELSGEIERADNRLEVVQKGLELVMCHSPRANNCKPLSLPCGCPASQVVHTCCVYSKSNCQAVTPTGTQTVPQSCPLQAYSKRDTDTQRNSPVKPCHASSGCRVLPSPSAQPNCTGSVSNCKVQAQACEGSGGVPCPPAAAQSLAESLNLRALVGDVQQQLGDLQERIGAAEEHIEELRLENEYLQTEIEGPDDHTDRDRETEMEDEGRIGRGRDECLYVNSSSSCSEEDGCLPPCPFLEQTPTTASVRERERKDGSRGRGRDAGRGSREREGWRRDLSPSLVRASLASIVCLLEDLRSLSSPQSSLLSLLHDLSVFAKTSASLSSDEILRETVELNEELSCCLSPFACVEQEQERERERHDQALKLQNQINELRSHLLSIRQGHTVPLPSCSPILLSPPASTSVNIGSLHPAGRSKGRGGIGSVKRGRASQENGTTRLRRIFDNPKVASILPSLSDIRTVLEKAVAAHEEGDTILCERLVSDLHRQFGDAVQQAAASSPSLTDKKGGWQRHRQRQRQRRKGHTPSESLWRRKGEAGGGLKGHVDDLRGELEGMKWAHRRLEAEGEAQSRGGGRPFSPPPASIRRPPDPSHKVPIGETGDPAETIRPRDPSPSPAPPKNLHGGVQAGGVETERRPPSGVSQFEWLITDVSKCVKEFPNGKCVVSPPFRLGTVEGFRMDLWPNGTTNSPPGVCSLGLIPPKSESSEAGEKAAHSQGASSAFIRYELYVGGVTRGPIDSRNAPFGVTFDMCELSGEESDALCESLSVNGTEVRALKAGVRLL
uniref:Uncharacterized protein n=1 Tax=Chromera velia CCMP2878 TaxID=1169474 RepID=A0A0G4H7D6_9ALVE|eukprot:Cvel_25031.t1-p1 / transcript=Cvel_25031.t1 / gene=Cvel_25031 / organism=Chromera_velia_CCMP2878 / gene_product=ELKS/Rab6-interacting/CAST family member 1, putative / transcript_product=ELKS/Rab6-interacting/CAST family member 1, putative / location=Cvel_scaffold2778:5981-11249(+) / protein_length=1020 / sequence_SO=supercontig / SO=protein_coding / is_pseudo=false